MDWSDKKVKPRRKHDDYFTTEYTVNKILKNTLNKTQSDLRVLDLCSGRGVWGEVYKTKFAPNSCVYGVEIQDIRPNKHFDYWYNDFDVLKYGTKDNLGKFDIVLSNPPFKYAQEMIEIGYDLLNDNGQMVFLLRLGFLASQKRYSFFQDYKPMTVYVLSERVKFEGYKGTYPMEYGAYKWGKFYDYEVETSELDWII